MSRFARLLPVMLLAACGGSRMSQYENEAFAEARAQRFGSSAETGRSRESRPPSRPHRPFPGAPDGEWVTGEVVRFGAVRTCGVGPLSVEIDAPPAWNRRFELDVEAHHEMSIETRLYVDEELLSRWGDVIGDGESSRCTVEIRRTGRRVQARRGNSHVAVTDVGSPARWAPQAATTRRVDEPPSGNVIAPLGK